LAPGSFDSAYFLLHHHFTAEPLRHPFIMFNCSAARGPSKKTNFAPKMTNFAQKMTILAQKSEKRRQNPMLIILYNIASCH
jgi:hypothetical protein